MPRRGNRRLAGHAPIPADGFVISAHGFPGLCGYTFLRRHLQKGGRVQVLAFPVPSGPVEAGADLGRGRHGVVVLLTALWPTPEKAELAELEIETTSRTSRRVRLNGSVSLPSLCQLRWHYSPARGAGWRLWPAWLQYDADNAAIVLAYEWRATDDTESGRRLRVVIEPEGRMYGTTLLGAAAW